MNFDRISAASRRSFLSGLSSTTAATLFATAHPSRTLAAIKTAFRGAARLAPEAVARDESLWATVRAAFSYNEEVLNLGSAVRGVAPTPVSHAVTDTYRRYNEYRPGGAYVSGWKEKAKHRLAAHVGCRPEEIALTRNTTDGVTTVLFGMNLKPGDEILTTTQEHEPYYGALDQRAARDRVAVRRVTLPLPAASREELIDTFSRAITSRTKLIMVCHVYLSGQIFPVTRLCEIAHARGIRVLVDGALAFGHLNVQIPTLGCDYYAASLHKWGGGPVATGLFYARPELVAQLPPLYGFYDQERQRPAFDSPSMEKFEMFGTHPEALLNSIEAMLDFREAIGGEFIAARLHYLKQRWIEQVKEARNLRWLVSPSPHHSCSLASFEASGNMRDLALSLWRQHKIMLGGAYVDGEFGKPETWREITLCNTGLFHSPQDLDYFASCINSLLGQR